MAARGVQKVVDKLKARVEEGAYYEAQQSYKASFYRFKAKKQLQDAYLLLKDGARQQLVHGQATCASELMLLLLEAYLDQRVPAEGACLSDVQGLLELFQQLQGDADDIVLELRRVTGATLKWCKKCGDRNSLREVHSIAGRSIAALQGSAGIGAASLYFSLSNDMPGFAECVKQAIAQGHKGEGELFRTRSILQVLAVAQKQSTYTHLEAARLLHQLLPKQDTALDHFLEFLLAALGKLSKPLYDVLVEKYKISLSRDPAFMEFMDRIESVFFGTGKATGGMGGLLGNLMGALSGESEE